MALNLNVWNRVLVLKGTRGAHLKMTQPANLNVNSSKARPFLKALDLFEDNLDIWKLCSEHVHHVFYNFKCSLGPLV